MFDPRTLGYLCDPAGRDARLDENIGNPDRKDSTYTEESVAGQKVYKLGFGFPKTTTRCVAWIDPAQGHNVTRIEYHELTKTGVNRLYVARSDLKQYGPERAWYPTRHTYEVFESGELRRSSVTAVTDCELNTPIDPRVFTLGGMGVPVGRGVAMKSRTESGRWDGERIVVGAEAERLAQKMTPPEAETLPRPVEPPRPNYWLIAAAVVLTGIAVVALGYAARRRRLAA
jgi:hypothetical protein